MSDHSIVFKIEGGWSLSASIVCHLGDTPDKKCATYEAHAWGDPTACRCTAEFCACRLGNHDDCNHITGWVEDMGPKCRLQPTGLCWFTHAMDEVGPEQFADFTAPPIPVELAGNGWDDAVEIWHESEVPASDGSET